MGALDVAGGLWLDRFLSGNNGNNNTSSNANNRVDYATLKEERRERIQANYAWLDEVLKTPRMFGYLLETDKMGFYRALAKAKEMFRSLYAERDYKNMMSDNFGNLEVNPEFVEMIEEIYYKEINPSAKIYDLKLARYNDLRDELIERTERNESVYTEESARSTFNISRAEMFEKLKNNELVWIYSIGKNLWLISNKKDYKQYLNEKRVKEIFPIAS